MPSVTALYNEQSLQAQLAARRNSAKAGMAMNQASTGLRTALAKYDSSAFAASKTFSALTGVLGQADRNTANLGAAIGVALGGATEIADLLSSMQTLATRANTDVLDAETAATIQTEFADLRNQIAQIVSTTRFNGTSVLNGSSVTRTSGEISAGEFQGAVSNTLAVGAYTFTASVAEEGGALTWAVECPTSDDADFLVTAQRENGTNVTQVDFYDSRNGELAISIQLNTVTVVDGDDLVLNVTASNVSYQTQIAENGTDIISASVPSMTLNALDSGLGAADISTRSGAESALSVLRDAMDVANAGIATLASYQRRLEAQSNNLQVTMINTEAARSSAADADMSAVIGEFVKFNTAAKIASAMTPKANDLHGMFLEQVQATR